MLPACKEMRPSLERGLPSLYCSGIMGSPPQPQGAQQGLGPGPAHAANIRSRGPHGNGLVREEVWSVKRAADGGQESAIPTSAASSLTLPRGPCWGQAAVAPQVCGAQATAATP